MFGLEIASREQSLCTSNKEASSSSLRLSEKSSSANFTPTEQCRSSFDERNLSKSGPGNSAMMHANFHAKSAQAHASVNLQQRAKHRRDDTSQQWRINCSSTVARADSDMLKRSDLSSHSNIQFENECENGHGYLAHGSHTCAISQ